jgi:signal transduction histidine kinase
MNSELTLGLLHQVNNVLTGIYFNVEECQAQVDTQSPLGATLEEISDSVRNLHRLLDRTVEVNLPLTEEDDASYHDLGELVSRQLDLIRILFLKTASIALLPPAEPVYVLANEQKFRRMLLQLVAALRDALPLPNARIVLELHARPAAPGQPGPMAAIAFRCERVGWDSIEMAHLQAQAVRWGWQISHEPALLLPQVDLEESFGGVISSM